MRSERLPGASPSAARRARGDRFAALALLLGIYLLGLGRIAMLPPFEGYDETGHYSYVAQLAGLGTWPTRGEPMSAETEDYAAHAPTAPSAGSGLRYAALPGASAEVRAEARAAVSSPAADPLWRGGTIANWEAQHPPLAYALLAPAFRWAARWSLGARLLLLRSLCYTLAWGGLCCAAWAAFGLGRSGPLGPAVAGPAALAPLLWPILLPEWFPEMARLGNDALVTLLAGFTWLALRRLLAAGAPAPRLGAHIGLGIVLGLGLLTKATMMPLAAAAFLALAAKASADRDGRRPRLAGLAACAVATMAVAGWWYIGQILRTGDPIGANDGVNLARGEGLWLGLQHHLSPVSLLRMVYDFDLSLVWNGTWSFVVPPLPFLIPMMIAFPLLIAAGLAMRRRSLTSLEVVAPLTLVLFTIALVYYSLVLIAGGGLGQPAWYLHSFLPVLWPLLAWGIDAARRSRIVRALLVADLVYAPMFLLFATACDAAFYAGCAGTRGGDRYVDVPAVLSCLAEPARLVDGLAALARPVPALWLLAVGFGCVGVGIWRGVMALSEGPRETTRPAAAVDSLPSRR